MGMRRVQRMLLLLLRMLLLLIRLLHGRGWSVDVLRECWLRGGIERLLLLRLRLQWVGNGGCWLGRARSAWILLLCRLHVRWRVVSLPRTVRRSRR